MTWDHLQSVSEPSDSATYTSSVSAGSKLIAIVTNSFDEPSTITGAQDGAGNAMTQVAEVNFPAPTQGTLAVFAMDVPEDDVGTTPTITVTVTDSFGTALLLQEVSGLAAGNTVADMIDGTAAVNSTSSANPATGGAYSTTAAGEYLLAAYGDGGFGADVTGTGYTADAANPGIGEADLFVGFKNSAGGAETLSWPLSFADDWGTVLLAFKLAGGGSPVTVPGAPSGLTAGTVTGTTVALSWTAPSAGSAPAEYLIFQNGTQVATATGTSAVVTGLSLSTEYSFSVAAENSAGTGPGSNTVTVTTSSTASVSLFGQTGSGTVDSATEPQVLGLVFTVSEAATLTAIWFYSASGATQLPAEVGLFSSSEELIFSNASPSWSGAAGSGWIQCACDQALAAGTYTAAAWNGAAGGHEWYSITIGGFTSGITNGPLSCTATPDTFADNSTTFAFPSGSFGSDNIRLDVEITTSSGAATDSGTASLTAAAALTAAARDTVLPSAHLAAAVTLTAAAKVARAASAHLAAAAALGAAARDAVLPAAHLASAPSLSSAAVISRRAQGALAANAVLTAAARLSRQGTAHLAAAPVLASAARDTVLPSAHLAAPAVLSPAAVVSRRASATLSADAALASHAAVTEPAAAHLAAQASMAAAAISGSGSQAMLAAAPVLTAGGSVRRQAAASLAAAPSLAASAVVARHAAAALSGAPVLTSAALSGSSSIVSMAAIAMFRCSASRQAVASAVLAAAPSLEAVPRVTAPAAVHCAAEPVLGGFSGESAPAAAVLAAVPSLAASAAVTPRVTVPAQAALAAGCVLTAVTASPGPDLAALWTVYQQLALRAGRAWENWRMMRQAGGTDGTAGFLWGKYFEASRKADEAYDAFVKAQKQADGVRG